jgi:hypothetical protein
MRTVERRTGLFNNVCSSPNSVLLWQLHQEGWDRHVAQMKEVRSVV